MHELLNSSKHLEHRGEWKAKTGEIQRSIKMQINRTGKGQESTTLTQMPACVHNSGNTELLWTTGHCITIPSQHCDGQVKRKSTLGTERVLRHGVAADWTMGGQIADGSRASGLRG